MSWVGRDPDHRKRVIAAFREHYVRGEGIICSQAEWDAIANAAEETCGG